MRLEGLCPLIQVFDMPASIAFYRDALGFEVVQTSAPGDDFDWALLRRDDAGLMLNTAYEADSRPAAPDPDRRDAHRDTALYFGCPDVDAAWRELREKNVAVQEPVVTAYGMKQMYVEDPDGYVLCFQWPAGE